MLDQGLILAPSDADKAIVKTWFEQGSLAGFAQQDLELNGHRWVRVTIKSLPAGDQIITVVDISELKAAIENAEIAASSKSNFLASMSHEIRTPMNGILGMVDLMKRSPLSEDQKEMVATIQDSGKALLSLINDILDISKIEAGRIELESGAFRSRGSLRKCAGSDLSECGKASAVPHLNPRPGSAEQFALRWPAFATNPR